MTNTEEKTKTIRVAAVQVQASLGQTAANLEHFTPLVERAASQGAQLIVLPELASCGYTMSNLIWDMGEKRDGITVQWLKKSSSRLGVYIGIGFVEADGEDFYNTYALGAPDGSIAGFVRKTMAETNCFRSAKGSHIIETEIGRIGVGICADNMFVANLYRMQAGCADILLMPHAAPLPFKTGGMVSEKDLSDSRQNMSGMASDRALRIGLPTVFVNLVGPRDTVKWAGIIGSMMSPDQFRLGGLSTIVDCEGKVLAHLNEEDEAVLIADVTLDPSKKVATRAKGHGTYGGGFVTPHVFVFEAICYIDSFIGGLSYRFSSERRQKARATL